MQLIMYQPNLRIFGMTVRVTVFIADNYANVNAARLDQASF